MAFRHHNRINRILFFFNSDYSLLHYSTLHYRHSRANAPYTSSDQWCINNYMLYEIQPTGPLPATQHVGYDKKENQLCSGANCSNTHNIISSMAPHEFNVVLRTTTDKFNVLPRTKCLVMPSFDSNSIEPEQKDSWIHFSVFIDYD